MGISRREIEIGESPEECLKREIKEEFSINIKVLGYFGENTHKYNNLEIKLIAYKALWSSGEIRLLEHQDYKWVSLNNIKNYDFAAADIPFVKKLIQEYKNDF